MTVQITVKAADGAQSTLTLPAPVVTPPSSGPTFDALGGVFTGRTTAKSPMSLSITASVGADIFLYDTSTPLTEYGPVRFNGAFMTELGGATYGVTDSTLFRIAGAGTGSAGVVSFTPPAAVPAAFVVFSVRNVKNVSTALNQSAAQPSWNFGSRACPSGSLLVCTLGMADETLTATLKGSGGTAIYTSPGPSGAGIYLATNTVATNFGGSLTGSSMGWVGAVMTCS